MRVTFCVAEEFLQEVRKDQDRVLRDIVRITCRYRRRGDVPLTSMYLCASCVVCEGVSAPDGPFTCVQLEELIGEEMVPEQGLRDRLGKARDVLEAALRELGLEVRAGWVEP